MEWTSLQVVHGALEEACAIITGCCTAEQHGRLAILVERIRQG